MQYKKTCYCIFGTSILYVPICISSQKPKYKYNKQIERSKKRNVIFAEIPIIFLFCSHNLFFSSKFLSTLLTHTYIPQIAIPRRGCQQRVPIPAIRAARWSPPVHPVSPDRARPVPGGAGVQAVQHHHQWYWAVVSGTCLLLFGEKRCDWLMIG